MAVLAVTQGKASPTQMCLQQRFQVVPSDVSKSAVQMARPVCDRYNLDSGDFNQVTM